MSPVQKKTLNSNHTKDQLLCLSNQFYCVIKLPDLDNTTFSSNIKDLLGIDDKIINLKSFITLIDSQDQEKFINSYKEIFNAIKQSFLSLKPFDCMNSIEFYMKNSKRETLNLLQQTCVYDIDKNNKSIVLLSIFTDITSINSLHHETSSIHKSQLSQNGFNLFTKRELEILNLLSTGKNSHEIADDLNISKHTVDTHRRKMLTKSQLANTAELIAYTFSNNIVQ